jgi:3-hydroxyisobutyrate dehydrogenase
LRLVLETSAATRTPLPGTALVNQVFGMLEAQGRGREGTQAIVDAVGRLGNPGG